ncbi:MAG: ATP-binding protein [Acidobacteria bacterium]|nr:MAG: ATP-binding protein [Acidobacteriota bacterium]REK11793.1 MAG: ATP-binding protein [Acidobacteriota bacterium]
MPAFNVADVHLSIDSQFENIELVQVLLEDSLQRLHLDEDSRYWIGIAIREAVANAIKHGNREDPDKQVTVRVRVVEEVLTIEVEDQGEGFEPTEVADPLAPDNLLKPDGRGIFYMKRFMDDIDYSFGPQGGTLVTLRKRLGERSADTEEEREDGR